MNVRCAPLPHCYVVNLPRRSDRRRAIEASLPPGLPASFTSDWVGHFDGQELTLNQLNRYGYRLFPWRIDSPNPWWSRPLKYGEIGCTLSHLRCWQEIARSGSQTAIILEDDAVLAPGFLTRLIEGLPAALQHCDLLYLGRVPQEPDRGYRDGFAVPGYSHCTYGYLLTQHAAQQLVFAGLDDALMPVDEFLPAMYLDHPRPLRREHSLRPLQEFSYCGNLCVRPHPGVELTETVDAAGRGQALGKVYRRQTSIRRGGQVTLLTGPSERVSQVGQVDQPVTGKRLIEQSDALIKQCSSLMSLP